MKHRAIILFTSIALILASCTKDEYLDNQSSVNGITQPLNQKLADLQFQKEMANLVKRPFKGHSTGTINFGPDPDCGNVPLVMVEGTGNATHLGKFTVQFEFCGDGMSPPFGTITAANGDQIFIVITGEEPGPTPLEPIQTVMVLSGNGRFTGVQGQWTNRGVIDVANQYFDHYSEGWIQY